MNKPEDIVKGQRYISNQSGLEGVIYLGCKNYTPLDSDKFLVIIDGPEGYGNYIGTIIPNTINNPIWKHGFEEIN